MQINQIPKTNTQHNINKKAVEQITNTKTSTVKKDDENKGLIIKPYLPVNICDNLILQNVYLSKCISTFAEDMVYNDINLKTKQNVEKINVEKIIEFWENNQEELCNQTKDYLSYGFGASEIYLNTNDELEIAQIPADTIYIKKIKKYNPETNQKEEYPYCVQTINGKETYLQLSHLDYPVDDDVTNVCFWMGGGRKSNFYDYPCWLECFNHVSASVSLDLLDADKLANGNLISGVLVIKRPPTPITMDNKDVEDTLEEKMENHGSGLFTLELTTLNPDIPLSVDYIQISESNYQYLRELADKSDNKILATFKMPKARLLIDDTTESMNSNKTNTLYKIYSLELNNSQRPLEKQMRRFNRKYFDNNSKVEIVTPVFVDDKEIEAQTTLNLFNNGLITLGQGIQKIQSIYPDLNDDTIDFDNPIYQERYYNGNPLGLIEPSEDEQRIYDIGEYIDTDIIEQKIRE